MNNQFLAISGEQWKSVSEKSKASLIARINDKIIQIPPVVAEQSYVEQITLTFYKNAKLVFVHDPAWMQSWEGYYFVTSGKRIFLLDGNSDVIHDMNKTLGLALDKNNVRDYLAFFCNFIISDGGTFPIFVGYSKKDAFSPKILKATKKMFLTESYVMYGSTLFQCQHEITPDGFVLMTEDKPLAYLETALTYNPHLRLTATENQQIH